MLRDAIRAQLSEVLKHVGSQFGHWWRQRASVPVKPVRHDEPEAFFAVKHCTFTLRGG